MQKKLKTIRALLAVLIGFPIWFYLLHEILERVNASELMWFLFWAYMPVNIVLVWIGNAIDE
jgi:hypothetical protein